MLGNIDLDEEIVKSPDAEEGEEEGSSTTSIHNAIKDEGQDIEVEEGKNADNQPRNKLRNRLRDKWRITI